MLIFRQKSFQFCNLYPPHENSTPRIAGHKIIITIADTFIHFTFITLCCRNGKFLNLLQNFASHIYDFLHNVTYVWFMSFGQSVEFRNWY